VYPISRLVEQAMDPVHGGVVERPLRHGIPVLEGRIAMIRHGTPKMSGLY
jgi:hypothetical protein